MKICYHFKFIFFLLILGICNITLSQDYNPDELNQNVWKISQISIRFQSTSQNLPDLSHQMLTGFSGNQQAQNVDMTGFQNFTDLDFFSENFFSENYGVYIGVSKPIEGIFSQYAEIGLDFHSNSEYVVDYYKDDNTNAIGSYSNRTTYIWCILNSGITGHLKYGLEMQYEKFQFRLGPGVSFGSTFDGELLLIINQNQGANLSSEESFGSVRDTQSLIGYLDMQIGYNFHKNFALIIQSKRGQGYVQGLNTKVTQSKVFGISLEYQFQ